VLRQFHHVAPFLICLAFLIGTAFLVCDSIPQAADPAPRLPFLLSFYRLCPGSSDLLPSPLCPTGHCFPGPFISLQASRHSSFFGTEPSLDFQCLGSLRLLLAVFAPAPHPNSPHSFFQAVDCRSVPPPALFYQSSPFLRYFFSSVRVMTSLF